MSRRALKHDRLVSLLKYLDVDYLDDALAVELSKLDINDPAQREEIIRTAIVPEFASMNEVSRAAMIGVLEEAKGRETQALEPTFSRMGMPFATPVANPKELLATIWRIVVESR